MAEACNTSNNQVLKLPHMIYGNHPAAVVFYPAAQPYLLLPYNPQLQQPFYYPPLVPFYYYSYWTNNNATPPVVDFIHPPPPQQQHYQIEGTSENTKRRGHLYSPPPRLRRTRNPSPTLNKNTNKLWKRSPTTQSHLRINKNDKTSLMIRNIPNHLRREELIQFLDFHCIQHKLEYDFLYLPMDFMRHNNFGYGFVNFTTSEAASRIMSLLDGFKWRADQSFLQVKSSKKICQVTFARIQGKRELVKHFQQSRFCCTESEYLPVTFSPPRNGSTSLPNPSTVGTLNCNQVLQKRLPGSLEC